MTNSEVEPESTEPTEPEPTEAAKHLDAVQNGVFDVLGVLTGQVPVGSMPIAMDGQPESDEPGSE